MNPFRSKLPLAGIRVIDFTQVVAGPYATMMLADMGAEIVKIERAGHGDDLRRTMPYKGREGHEDYFNALNRSKKSVALNLKDKTHLEIALQLMKQADVVVENFSPGTVDRLGVGWEAAHRLNPRLVYCSLSGFGQTGPHRNRLALDSIIQAVTGVMSVTGFPDADPVMVGAPLADVISGMFAAYTIVSALRLVTDEGGGQFIDLSMQDALLAAAGTRMGETLQAGIAPPRLGNENPLRVPANTYRTADDRYIAVMVHDQGQWKPFCEAMDELEWLDDPRFATMALRLEHRNTMDELVARRIARMDSAHWAERLTKYRIPYALVNDYIQALEDTQVKHRGLLREVNHPVSGKIKVVGPPWRMSETPTEVRSPPTLGQHTAEVLHEWLGINVEELK
jgi:crotonobetainyl-CoA:carnitine CoA-transferase CaiB-like acyl-CoA transferase